MEKIAGDDDEKKNLKPHGKLDRRWASGTRARADRERPAREAHPTTCPHARMRSRATFELCCGPREIEIEVQ